MSRTKFSVCRYLLVATLLLVAMLGVLPGRADAQVVRGACCFANGSCTVYQNSVCRNRSGTWRGARTTCSPNVCPQPRGACCLADGGCAWVTAVGCTARRGTYQGNSTICGVRVCPRPSPPAGNPNPGPGGTTPAAPVPQIGACCLTDFTCIETSEADCATRGGAFQGLGRPCFQVYCPAASPPQACCFPDGSCVTTTQIDCIGRGGYGRASTACSPTACLSTGACCAASGGTCSQLTDTACAAAGGSFRGNFSSCTSAGCGVTGAGACCLRDSSCVVVQSSECTTLAGRFRGVNAGCSTQYCVDNTVGFACCLQDSTCVMTTQRDCMARRGIWGNGSMCQPLLCPVMGACCFSDSRCQSTGMGDCVTLGGTFDANRSCNIQFCPRACPCNWNGDRWVNEGDLFRFVSDFMQGRADYDNNGVTDESDGRQFIECLLHHPPGC